MAGEQWAQLLRAVESGLTKFLKKLRNVPIVRRTTEKIVASVHAVINTRTRDNMFYNVKSLNAAVEFISKHSKNFAGQNSYIRKAIFHYMDELDKNPEDRVYCTMGFRVERNDYEPNRAEISIELDTLFNDEDDMKNACVIVFTN